MNERIKELYQKAHKEVVETNDYNGMPSVELQFDPEKFAELIVQECLIFTNPSPHEGTDFGSALSWAHKNIKEHFGVEK